MKKNKGIHYIDTFLECKNKKLMDKSRFCKEVITEKIGELGLTCVGYASKNFKIGGFSAVWLLEESHISLHTWPELGSVDMDIYVCNYSRDNSKRAKYLYEFLRNLFKSKKSKLRMIKR